MFFIQQFIYAFISTIGFSIIFNIPKDSILKSGIGGAMGWLVYISTEQSLSSPTIGALLGAITVGVIGEIFARLFKKPATVFIIPGIVPLVPGAGMYYTMLAIIEKRFYDAANKGTETLFIAASIASGTIIATSLSKTLLRNRRRTRKL